MELWRKKNTATRIVFPIIDADGDVVTGAADLDSEYSLFNTADHGGAAPSFSDCEHEATEIGATGIYYLDVAAGEVNADFAYIQVKTSTSGAKTQHLLIRTMVADPLHIATTDDDNAIDASALNTLSGHDPGATLVKVADLPAAAPSAATIADAVLDEAAAGHAGFITTLALEASVSTVDGKADVIQAVTDKLDTALEADAAVYRFTANALEEGPTGGAVPSAADVADAVWNEAIGDHAGAGSTGAKLAATYTGTPPTAGAVADAVWEEALADHSGTAGSTAEQIANIATGSPPTAAAIRAEIDANSTQLAAILVDTGTDLPASITALGSPMQAGAETTIADGVLLRHTEDIEASAGDDTLAYAIMRSTNRTHRNVNVLETYRRDGVTLHAYQQLTPDPTGQPVSDISGAEAV